MMVETRFHDETDSYRYGFKGQERDEDLKGKGNSLNYTFRMHDPRIGRFFAIDPLASKYPHYTPYSFSGNKVIHAVELEGLEEAVIIGSNQQVKLTNEFNANLPKSDQNWSAYKFIDLKQAKLDVQRSLPSLKLIASAEMISKHSTGSLIANQIMIR